MAFREGYLTPAGTSPDDLIRGLPNIREMQLKERPTRIAAMAGVESQNRGVDKCLILFARMARETGLEPAASAVTGRRSNQLSYSRGLRNLARAGMRT
jgi:hypothetical protein